jgi:uncharacterized lipoprotein
MIKTSKYNILTSLFLVLFAGCSSFNDKAIREKQTTDYQRNLTEETNNVLSKKESFDLNDCIQIAIEPQKFSSR